MTNQHKLWRTHYHRCIHTSFVTRTLLTTNVSNIHLYNTSGISLCKNHLIVYVLILNGPIGNWSRYKHQKLQVFVLPRPNTYRKLEVLFIFFPTLHPRHAAWVFPGFHRKLQCMPEISEPPDRPCPWGSAWQGRAQLVGPPLGLADSNGKVPQRADKWVHTERNTL